MNKMETAIHLIYDTVKSTLGPKGKNVIIDHSAFQPFITNDGVTIAENIESDDAVLETILTLAKEASIHTNNTVGDGTTTTIVLLGALFDSGLEMIKKGIAPLILKKELDESLKKIKNEINKKSRKPHLNELQKIATVAVNNTEDGMLISNAYKKVKNRLGIQLIEHDCKETYYQHIKGYTIESNLASPYFLNDSNIKLINNPYLLLFENALKDIDLLSETINKIILQKKDLIIFAEDYDQNIVQEILSLNAEIENKIYLLKTPEYGVKQQEILNDISSITNTIVVKNHQIVAEKDLGEISKIRISKKNITFFYQKSKAVDLRKKQALAQLKNAMNDLDKEWYSKRYNMFQNGLINIFIGAPTTIERREKKMRFEDALWAVDTAQQGIIPGSGIVLLELSEKMPLKTSGDQILKAALSNPFLQILKNAGLNSEEIYNQIKNLHFSCLYNVQKETYEKIQNTDIMDPTKVILEALENAVSIVGMLLTTNHLIINEHNNESFKNSIFNEY